MSSTSEMPEAGPRGRVFPLVVAIAAVTMAFFGTKWQLGDMVAQLTGPQDENASFAADVAVGLAPRDARANALRTDVGPDPNSFDHRTEVEMAEETVRLAPYDHRWRIALARALVNDGQTERAEAQFKHALDLAPTYADGRWYYGNFLLRQGRLNDAIPQFKIAAQENPDYRAQVLSLLWDYSAHDPSTLISVAGDSPESVMQLATFLAVHGKGDDAVALWEQLDAQQRLHYANIAVAIAESLSQQHRTNAALKFSRYSGADPDAAPEIVTNGSFESSIEAGEHSHFSWRILRKDPRLDIALDSQVRQEGTRSLRLNFRGTAKTDLFNVAQTIAVQPGGRYRLTFWLRTENLKAAAGPFVDIALSDESRSLGHTGAFPNGTSDWRQMSVDISVPGDADGIEIRTVRTPCSGDDCPINGIIWYDNFMLTRIQ